MTWFKLKFGYLVGLLDKRQPPTLETLLRDFLPPFICLYATAVLVLLPRTRVLRFSLLPLMVWLSIRGATQLDYSYGNGRFAFLNQVTMIVFTFIVLRATTWTLQSEPFRRIESPTKQVSHTYNGHAASPTIPPAQLVLDAFELCCNVRGLGWNWSASVYVPPQHQWVNSKTAFVIVALASYPFHFILSDVAQYGIQFLAPPIVSSPNGGSIFDTSLPPAEMYLRSSAMTVFTALFSYCGLRMYYDLFSVIGVLGLGHHPSQWPPIFNSPWFATSVTDFWGKRWHQVFRYTFGYLGGYPLSLAAGRAGYVMGTFLMSAALHDLGTWAMGRGTDLKRVGGFFLMNGVGVLLEHLWRRVTGHRVGGFIGWAWAALWVVGWGNMLTEGWAQKGVFGTAFLPVHLRPSTYLFGVLPHTL